MEETNKNDNDNDTIIKNYAVHLNNCVDIATRWNIEAIKKNISDKAPFSVFGTFVENQTEYFNSFKKALRTEIDNPNNGEAFMIDIKDMFLPIINTYFDWYNIHKSETDSIEYNFYEWIYNSLVKTEHEINKYSEIYSNDDDNTNPLILAKTIIEDLHREFNGFLWPETDFDNYKNYFRKEPVKIVRHETTTLNALCYFFSKIEEKSTVKIADWIKYHIRNSNYGKLKAEFINLEDDIKIRKNNGSNLTKPQKRVLSKKQEIDEKFKKIHSV